MPTRKPLRDQPEYPLSEVDSLPPQYRGGRSRLYYNLLLSVKQRGKTGKWVLLSEYRTGGSARRAMQAIQRGEVDIPAGEWDFEWRRLLDEGTGNRVSNLYVKYKGETT